MSVDFSGFSELHVCVFAYTPVSFLAVHERTLKLSELQVQVFKRTSKSQLCQSCIRQMANIKEYMHKEALIDFIDANQLKCG